LGIIVFIGIFLILKEVSALLGLLRKLLVAAVEGRIDSVVLGWSDLITFT